MELWIGCVAGCLAEIPRACIGCKYFLCRSGNLLSHDISVVAALLDHPTVSWTVLCDSVLVAMPTTKEACNMDMGIISNAQEQLLLRFC